MPKPVRPKEILGLTLPVTGKVNNVKMGYSPVILEFELADFSGEINMNNAMTSFELHVDGQLTHFYFWTFKETAPDVAKVQLRLEWPLDAEDFDKVEVSLRPIALVKATPRAFITKHEGAKSDLTIIVTEVYANGMTKEVTETFPVDSNHAGTFKVG